MKKLQGKQSGALPNEKSKAIYEDAILEMLFDETNYQIKDLLALLVYMTEKYHPAFNIKVRGRPTLWTPFIKALLAVEIDHLKATGIKSRKEAAKLLTEHETWKSMTPLFNRRNKTAGADQFEAKDKEIRIKEKDLYESVQKRHKKYLATNDLEGWNRLVLNAIDRQQKLGDKSKK
jgi:hypothetical protein